MSNFAKDVLDDLKMNEPMDSEDHDLLSNSASAQGGTDEGGNGYVEFDSAVTKPMKSFVQKIVSGKLFDEQT